MDPTEREARRRLISPRAALLALAILAALGIVGAAVSVTLDQGSAVRAGRFSFDYFAHHITPSEPPNEPGGRHNGFGGASGIAVLPGSLIREGETAKLRAVVVCDHPTRASMHEFELAFTPSEEGWQMSATRLREIRLLHPRRDAESVVVLPSNDGKAWYAISYELGNAIATLSDPPTQRPRKNGATDPRLLDIPDDIITHAVRNRGFETLALKETDTGALELWAILESELATSGNGASETRGAACPVLIYRVDDPENISLDRRLTYTTKPLPKSLLPIARINSVSDAGALPDGSLAVLERHASALGGFDATLFRILESDNGTLTKTRLASIKEIAGHALPWTGNHEGITLGPRMSEITGDPNDPGHLLLLVADDNYGADYQRGTQFLALRVRTHQ